MSISRRAAAALALAVAGCVGANLGIAGYRYGLEYIRRRLLWGTLEDMRDPHRFPARAIAASLTPFRFNEDAEALPRIRQAFARIGPRHGVRDESLEAFLARTQTTSFLILHRDRLVGEFYANGASRGTLLTSMSMSKSLLALLTVSAIADGAIASFDTPATMLLPDIAGLRNSSVTLRDLMHMAGGLQYENPWPLHRLTIPSLFEGSRVAYFTPDIRSYIATASPGVPPGSRFRYDDRSAQLVGLIVACALHATVSDGVARRLWDPIGAEYPASWNLDRDGGFEKMESGFNAAAVDWLKLGRLVLNDGVLASSRRLLPAGLLRTVTSPGSDTPDYVASNPNFNDGLFLFYGLLWWGFADPGGPPDCFATGLFGQVLYVSRRSNTVLLRTGLAEGGVASWPRLLHDLASAVQYV